MNRMPVLDERARGSDDKEPAEQADLGAELGLPGASSSVDAMATAHPKAILPGARPGSCADR